MKKIQMFWADIKRGTGFKVIFEDPVMLYISRVSWIVNMCSSFNSLVSGIGFEHSSLCLGKKYYINFQCHCSCLLGIIDEDYQRLYYQSILITKSNLRKVVTKNIFSDVKIFLSQFQVRSKAQHNINNN